MIDETEASFRTAVYGFGTVCAVVVTAVVVNGYRALSHFRVYWGSTAIWTLLLAVSLGMAVSAATYIVQWEHNRKCVRDMKSPDYFLRGSRPRR